MSDWTCWNCGKQSGEQGHSFGSRGDGQGAQFSCTPTPEWIAQRTERQRSEQAVHLLGQVEERMKPVEKLLAPTSGQTFLQAVEHDDYLQKALRKFYDEVRALLAPTRTAT